MIQFRTFLFGITLAVTFVILEKPTFAQARLDSTSADMESCGQPKNVRDPLIDEAEREQFNVRRVEIVGSTYTRYREFSKRMLQNEGDIFSRKYLEESVKSIAKMRVIFPITMENVEVRLNREYKDIDFIFCVRQKPKR